MKIILTNTKRKKNAKITFNEVEAARTNKAFNLKLRIGDFGLVKNMYNLRIS